MKIAYDMTHNASGRQGSGRPTNPTGFYATMFGDLIARGATVTEIFTFDLGTFQSYDILWIEEDWTSVLTVQEFADLQTWVYNGGRVFICGDEWDPPIFNRIIF